jgi:hypothetical protein
MHTQLVVPGLRGGVPLPRWAALATTLLLSLGLSACGGGSSPSASATSTPAAVAARGDLLDTPATVATLSATQIDTMNTDAGLRTLAGAARCDVKVVSLNYRTPAPDGLSSNATGVLLVPTGACTSAAPLLAYARGTEVNRNRTLASASDPETALLIGLYAAQGYAVVASDYLGYAGSALSYHPYLHADSEASTVIDAVRAARHAATQHGLSLTGRVMLSGYSQGGHASAAAQRQAESSHAAEIQVVGAAHMSGPYALSAGWRQPTVIAGYQFFVPLMVRGWQQVYGNLYTQIDQVFRAPYAPGIDTLLPAAGASFTSLLTSGTLPGGLGETPTQVRDALMQPDYLQAIATQDDHPLLAAARRNDLLGWTPQAPVLLCAGAADPTVLYAVNQAALAADFSSRGVAQVSVVDVDPTVQALYGVNGQAPTDPSASAFSTYYANYHARLVPPLCHARARAFFDTLR